MVDLLKEVVYPLGQVVCLLESLLSSIIQIKPYDLHEDFYWHSNSQVIHNLTQLISNPMLFFKSNDFRVC